jgi:predicted nucleic acid-binding protein
VLTEFIVADTGPLLALARLDGLRWLADVIAPVRISQSVFAEAGFYQQREDFVRVSNCLRTDSRYALIPDYIDQVVARGELGKGETVTLSIARRDDAMALVDDRDARVLASSLGVRIAGTLGILLAKRRGLIDAVAPRIRHLEASGYFLSWELVREVLKVVGER